MTSTFRKITLAVFMFKELYMCTVGYNSGKGDYLVYVPCFLHRI